MLELYRRMRRRHHVKKPMEFVRQVQAMGRVNQSQYDWFLDVHTREALKKWPKKNA